MINFKRRSCHTLTDTDLWPTTKDNCSTVHCVSLNSFSHRHPPHAHGPRYRMHTSCTPHIVPQSVKCFNSKMVKHCALTNVNADRGFESWPGYEVKPADWHSSLETHGQMKLDFPVTGRIFGRRADVVHPRSGSFGPHGHRIDFCESVVLNHFAIKAFFTLRNNNWIQLIVPQSVKCFNKMVKYCALTDRLRARFTLSSLLCVSSRWLLSGWGPLSPSG
jgi:hypothetical protein